MNFMLLKNFLMTDKEQLSLEEITALFDTFNLTYTTDTLASVVKVLDLSFTNQQLENVICYHKCLR